MEKLKFTFKMLAASDGKSNVLCVTRITTTDGNTFKIPNEYSNALLHVELLKTAAYTKIKKTCSQRGQTRRVWVSLTKEMRNTYFDEDGNIQFESVYLEEVSEESSDTTTSTSAPEHSLEKLLEKILKKNQENSGERNVGKLATEFTIGKFDGKNANAEQWLRSFEKECERFEIDENCNKIEILKSFMEKVAADWYDCTLLKLTITAEWNDWRENFCKTFSCKGWSPIKYAIAFRYQAGSLLEYSMKKEKLLLQVRKTMDSDTLVDLIAMGLPNSILDKIDREKIVKSEDLHNELNKLEHLTMKKNSEVKKFKPDFKGKTEKIPCKICKDNNKGTRFHPEMECWFRDPEKKGNKLRQVNNLTLDVELSTDDTKN
ncbi:uncharacterized protein LOC123682001 [Harmonia axyridis]|uniref:uncharacterized protein LOC123682001 n=1 Tax=Harmonia axyridis TaxID=115357 RepID=UPI001E276ABA|nr:uncharacterized protein LOC123682001 [Harmonia axyridis]